MAISRSSVTEPDLFRQSKADRWEDGMAKGIYRMPDGQVMVDYGRRRAPISRAQYKANGYQPTYDKLGGPPQGAKGAPRAAARPAKLTTEGNSSQAPTENASDVQRH